MAEAIKPAGGTVKLTVCPAAGDDSWTQTCDNPELYQWFLEQERSRQ